MIRDSSIATWIFNATESFQKPEHENYSKKLGETFSIYFTKFWILLGNMILEIWFEYIESKLNVCIVLYIKNVPDP